MNCLPKSLKYGMFDFIEKLRTIKKAFDKEFCNVRRQHLVTKVTYILNES